jgi:hypothetical protein
VGYKAQNNTQSAITDPDTIERFQNELITEHMTAQAQAHPAGTKQQAKLPPAGPPPSKPAKKTTSKATKKAAKKK